MVLFFFSGFDIEQVVSQTVGQSFERNRLGHPRHHTLRVFGALSRHWFTVNTFFVEEKYTFVLEKIFSNVGDE